MIDARQETVADIVAAMRDESHAGDGSFLEWVGEKMRRYADRIEAAEKREREATREKSSAVGNAAAIREALLEASIALSDATHHHMTEDDAKECLAVVVAALSVPPRNCDVGTAEEQYKRFDKICSARGLLKDCPLFEKTSPCCSPLCFARWSQIPYEEGGAK